jgi:hypothetical protein
MLLKDKPHARQSRLDRAQHAHRFARDIHTDAVPRQDGDVESGVGRGNIGGAAYEPPGVMLRRGNTGGW